MPIDQITHVDFWPALRCCDTLLNYLIKAVLCVRGRSENQNNCKRIWAVDNLWDIFFVFVLQCIAVSLTSGHDWLQMMGYCVYAVNVYLRFPPPLLFRLTLIRQRLMWSSWRRSRPMRRCSWSTPCSSRAMWVTWTQVSYALTVPTQHDVPQTLRAAWAFQCTSLENTRKCKANLQVERNKTVRSQHWMLGKHSSVETTV